jgi:hypothetical protein
MRRSILRNWRVGGGRCRMIGGIRLDIGGIVTRRVGCK